MTTSSLGLYTRFDESLVDDENPVDTGLMYRAINNLNHLADQYAQHRVNWVIPAGKSGLEVDPSGEALTETNRVFLYRSLPFDMHVREDGTTYDLLVWLRTQSNHATHTATFDAVLSPAAPGTAYSDGERAAAGVNVGTTTATSTTAAWSQVSPAALTLDQRMVARSTDRASTVDTVGGPERGVDWLRVELWVYCGVSDVLATPELSGVRAVEYLSP